MLSQDQYVWSCLEVRVKIKHKELFGYHPSWSSCAFDNVTTLVNNFECNIKYNITL